MSRNSARREIARRLRRDLTPAERILWQHLRNRALGDIKFRRQHPIGPFFADMACAECKLVIESDGETLLGHEARDQQQSAGLRPRPLSPEYRGEGRKTD